MSQPCVLKDSTEAAHNRARRTDGPTTERHETDRHHATRDGPTDLIDVDLIDKPDQFEEPWNEVFPIGTIPATRNNHISVVVHRTKVFIHGGHDGDAHRLH